MANIKNFIRLVIFSKKLLMSVHRYEAKMFMSFSREKKAHYSNRLDFEIRNFKSQKKK